MTGVVSILAAVIGLTVWLIRRAVSRRDDPVWQRKVKDEEIAQDIISGDGVDAGSHLAADLDELERLQRAKGDPQR